jgi:hypothetical protein
MALDGEAAAGVAGDGRDLIVYGTLRLLGGSVAGVGACVQAVDGGAALDALGIRPADGVTVRPWRSGGRPAAGDG